MLRRRFWQRDLQNAEDEVLVAGFQRTGRDYWFEVLFDRYHALVYGLCLSLTARREDSKDLTLKVFQKAYEALPKTSIERFDHWLFTLARHECLRFLRAQTSEQEKRRRWQETQLQQEAFMANEAFRAYWYNEQFVQDKLLREGLATLSPAQQQCLQLFLYDYQSYREIATNTGFTLKEVKSHLQNGRLKLKRWVRQQQDTT